jgi:hypothetical protein
VAKLCDSDDEVRVLGNADPSLIPYIVSEPSLQPRQFAYRKAVCGKTGPELLAGLHKHLREFWASPDSEFWIHEDEPTAIIQELCRLRNQRGPVPLLRIKQEGCSERLMGIPADVHVDITVSTSLFCRRQAPWTIPAQASCLFLWPPRDANEFVYGRQIVRGRHAFASSQELMNIDIGDLDLTRGRLDLSKIAGCGFLEMWGCRIGRGDFGLRWPSSVSRLRIVNCTFEDQTASFELPDGLLGLDLSNTPIASAAPNWRLPASIQSLETQCSPIAAHILPPLLPPELKELTCFTENFAPQLKKQILPQSLVAIWICEMGPPHEQTRRLKLAKRNWQRELKKQHPTAYVRIR